MTDEIALTGAERDHLARARLEAESGRLTSDARKVRAASDAYLRWCAAVAVALTRATATCPPARPGRSVRRSGVSDPTADTTMATLAAVTAGAATFAHLLGRCPQDQTDEGCQTCNLGSLQTVAAALGIDTDWTTPHITRLLELRQPHEVPPAVRDAAHVHAIVVRNIGAVWHTARGTIPPDRLASRADELAGLAARMRALAHRLGQWAPGVHGHQRPLTFCARCGAPAKYPIARRCNTCNQKDLRARQGRKDPTT